jgi:hypothetical protein
MRMTHIRAAVEQGGSSLVGRDDLRVLCPDDLSVSQQFARIAEGAQGEGWSFAFRAGGDVRFAELEGERPGLSAP